jgi:large subunit ribosomal protein L24
MPIRIKKNDKVIVISGRDSGTVGQVLRVIPSQNKVFVEGVNKVKRHQKPTQGQPQGGIVTKELALHLSKVMLVDPKTNKPTRMRAQIDKDGKKLRVAVGSGAILESK